MKMVMRILQAFLLFALVSFGAAAEPSKRPHIIMVLADDLGAGDLSCYGGTQVETPNIDRLAEEGIRFTQYYSASPICSPSRAGLITGMFPARWGITSFLQTRAGNRGVEQNDYLHPDAPSLPRTLQAAGYATAHFGKWHLGGGRDVTDAPKFSVYGYDEHAGTYESPEPHADITATNWIWSEQDKVKRWDRTTFFVDRTLDFLGRHHEQQPCFVNLWLDDPHTPWIPSADAARGDSHQNLSGVLKEMDQQVGRLLDGLRKLNIDQNTVVIFTSDNGPLPTFKRVRTTGLRGSKLSLYEGGIRVPLIVRWPGHVPAKQEDTKTVMGAVDFFPTLCAIAGAKVRSAAKLDGQNMADALRGAPINRDQPLFWEYGRNDEFFKYPRSAQDRSPNLAVRHGRWKLLINGDGSGAELYDVVSDKNEQNNVAEQQQGVTKDLTEQVLEWHKSLP
jgi:arylsulfatase A-like enzyme